MLKIFCQTGISDIPQSGSRTHGGNVSASINVSTTVKPANQEEEPGGTGEPGGPGEPGDPGSGGNWVNQGHQGDQGHQGNQGNQGTRGNWGNRGHQGDPGTQVTSGTGGTREPGGLGEMGNQGDHGTRGTRGTRGTGKRTINRTIHRVPLTLKVNNSNATQTGWIRCEWGQRSRHRTADSTQRQQCQNRVQPSVSCRPITGWAGQHCGEKHLTLLLALLTPPGGTGFLFSRFVC